MGSAFGEEFEDGNISFGALERANNGTLFLDEIGDMPVEAQTRLLRVLQDGCFTAVGGKEVIQTNVRIVTAAIPEIKEAITNNQDLFKPSLALFSL